MHRFCELPVLTESFKMNNAPCISASCALSKPLGSRYICGMRLFLLVFAVLIIHSGSFAQEDLSLTSEFAQLSAKERSKIAKKENMEAAGDVTFQGMMKEGEDLFQSGEYNAALDVFKNARQRRPYNVHPKVKIQDLQALIAMEEEMNGELANDQESVVISSLNTSTPASDSEIVNKPELVKEPIAAAEDSENGSPVEEEPEAIEEIKAAEQPDLIVIEEPTPLPEENTEESEEVVIDKPVPEPKTKPVPVKQTTPTVEHRPIKEVPTKKVLSMEDVPELEDGLSKEVYREANAVITEYTSILSGKTDIYKKVYHQWGYVFYFKNGAAITEHMWNQETASFH